jgi:hypothetical protein
MRRGVNSVQLMEISEKQDGKEAQKMQEGAAIGKAAA